MRDYQSDYAVERVKEQTMSDDLIRRSDVMLCIECARTPTAYGEKVRRKIFDGVIKIPSADRPQGEWIDEADKYDASFGIHDYRCSNCNSYADEYICGHEWYTAGKPNFCPHCGAHMKGADDE